ncbi:MAG: GH116 family glycosyl hydrolase [Candidatus Woesearchaeota archaeon]
MYKINIKSIKKAYYIAIDNLRQCYSEKGIFAGLHHFKDYWARDSFFASFGSLSIGDYDIVKKNLSLFLNNLNNQGQVPLRIGKTSIEIVLSYLTKKYDGKRKPIYFIDKGKKFSIDQNSLLIIAFYEYLKKTKDFSFLKENLEKLEKAMQWNFSQDLDKDYLIEENEYCNWADSIKKKGKVLYTNVCFCYSLKCMAELYSFLNNKKEKEFFVLYKKTKEKINTLFWNETYYIDWLETFKNKSYDYFSLDGNYLAILWKIASKENAKKILDYSLKIKANETLRCVYPDYSENLISTQIKLIGLKEYHRNLTWIWLISLMALVFFKSKSPNNKKISFVLLERLSELIFKHNAVYEIYENNAPFKKFYKSEMPFAWSSGLFVYAYNKIKREIVNI